MNSKTGITFSITAIAAVIVLFGPGPLVANQQVQAFPSGGFRGGLGGLGDGGGLGFHNFGFHNFGFHNFGFHHPFFFHRHFFFHPFFHRHFY